MSDGLPRYSDALFMTVPDAAVHLGVSDQTVYNYMRDGRLKALDKSDAARNPTGQHQVLRTDVSVLHAEMVTGRKLHVADSTDPLVMELQMAAGEAKDLLKAVIAEKDAVIASKEETIRSKDQQIKQLTAQLKALHAAQIASSEAFLANLD